jgi:hypothetical protein
VDYNISQLVKINYPSAMMVHKYFLGVQRIVDNGWSLRQSNLVCTLKKFVPDQAEVRENERADRLAETTYF